MSNNSVSLLHLISLVQISTVIVLLLHELTVPVSVTAQTRPRVMSLPNGSGRPIRPSVSVQSLLPTRPRRPTTSPFPTTFDRRPSDAPSSYPSVLPSYNPSSRPTFAPSYSPNSTSKALQQNIIMTLLGVNNNANMTSQPLLWQTLTSYHVQNFWNEEIEQSSVYIVSVRTRYVEERRLEWDEYFREKHSGRRDLRGRLLRARQEEMVGWEDDSLFNNSSDVGDNINSDDEDRAIESFFSELPVKVIYAQQIKYVWLEDSNSTQTVVPEDVDAGDNPVSSFGEGSKFSRLLFTMPFRQNPLSYTKLIGTTLTNNTNPIFFDRITIGQTPTPAPNPSPTIPVGGRDTQGLVIIVSVVLVVFIVICVAGAHILCLMHNQRKKHQHRISRKRDTHNISDDYPNDNKDNEPTPTSDDAPQYEITTSLTPPMTNCSSSYTNSKNTSINVNGVAASNDIDGTVLSNSLKTGTSNDYFERRPSSADDHESNNGGQSSRRARSRTRSGDDSYDPLYDRRDTPVLPIYDSFLSGSLHDNTQSINTTPIVDNHPIFLTLNATDNTVTMMTIPEAEKQHQILTALDSDHRDNSSSASLATSTIVIPAPIITPIDDTVFDSDSQPTLPVLFVAEDTLLDSNPGQGHDSNLHILGGIGGLIASDIAERFQIQVVPTQQSPLLQPSLPVAPVAATSEEFLYIEDNMGGFIDPLDLKTTQAINQFPTSFPSGPLTWSNMDENEFDNEAPHHELVEFVEAQNNNDLSRTSSIGDEADGTSVSANTNVNVSDGPYPISPVSHHHQPYMMHHHYSSSDDDFVTLPVGMAPSMPNFQMEIQDLE